MRAFAKPAALYKPLTAWAVMLLVCVANGAARDFTYGRTLSELAAHQLSTASGIALLSLVIGVYCRLVPFASIRQAASVGLFWMFLTLAFEFLFFHYVGGHAWSALLSNYDVLAGRVWVFLLLWIAVAPPLFFMFSTHLSKAKRAS